MAVRMIMADPTTTPDIFSPAVSFFNGGSNYGAGNYRVSYSTGAYKINPGAPWGVEYKDNDTQIGLAHGFYITDGQGNVARGPGNTVGYTSESLAISGNAGLYVDYIHGGGPIGMYLYDGKYVDNIPGAATPTFSLSALPAVSFTAAPVNGPCGQYLLGWVVGPEATLISSVSIDQGIGSVSASGTHLVTVISGSQMWTLTAVSTAGTIIAQVTVSVATYAGVASSPTVIIDGTSSTVAYFNSSADYPAGRYFIKYITGAFQWAVKGSNVPCGSNVQNNWTVGSPTNNGNPGGVVITDGGGNTGIIPVLGGSCLGGWQTQSAAIAAQPSGVAGTYCHVGGRPIGCYVIDSVYTDNSNGSPSPTFMLVGPAPAPPTPPAAAARPG